MKISFRNVVISLFVILWLGVFHYESTRFFYLNRFFRTELPKFPLLFPPAGWIMFYNVGESFGYRQVFGVKGKTLQDIPHHDIFRTRTFGFDNIHRGIVSTAAEPRKSRQFCAYLKYRFPYFDNFYIKVSYYPDPAREPHERYERFEYKCWEDAQ